MKRFISILLVLVSICSISISSLAEGASINATQSPSLIKTFGATVASGTTGYINIRTAPNTGAGIVTSIDANSGFHQQFPPFPFSFSGCWLCYFPFELGCLHGIGADGKTPARQ